MRCAAASCRNRATTNAVSLVALLDAKLFADHGAGFREADMPYMRDAWRKALAAIDGEARAQNDGRGFSDLSGEDQDALLSAMQQGKISGDRWTEINAKTFFERRVLVDVPTSLLRTSQGLERDRLWRSRLAARLRSP